MKTTTQTVIAKNEVRLWNNEFWTELLGDMEATCEPKIKQTNKQKTRLRIENEQGTVNIDLL